MDTLWRLASGSTVEEFAKDVYIKSNITIELSKTIKSILKELAQSDTKLVIESRLVVDLCHIFEAILLHGLKQKLSTRMTNVFMSLSQTKSFGLDFWTVILILCHNEVSKTVSDLSNVSTDIGRCRAWVRSALSDGLILSYFDALTADSSLLHGFYQSSAYIRDKEHTDIVKRLLIGLEDYVFNLTIDCSTFDSWDEQTLRLIGVNYMETEPQPVITATDAIDLIDNFESNQKSTINEIGKQDEEEEDIEPTNNEDFISDNTSETISDIKSNNSNEAFDEIVGKLELESTKCLDSEVIESGNSLNRMSGWSTTPHKSDEMSAIRDQSYDDILQSYSTQAVLSSTPDIRDFTITIDFENPTNRPHLTKTISMLSTKEKSPTDSLISETDFEVIPKSVVLNNSDPETKKFLDQLTRLANECGLDEQDYKCIACGRPIGMIYGKSRLCYFDGYHYCLDCHSNDESLIPARVIHNWNFGKYPVAKRNKHFLVSTELEPLFDIKILSPLLYSIVGEMKEALDLRTQLFYLHAYLFTCQENIAIEMRKTVWPREHLFQHIHLYSVADLFQVQNNQLSQTLTKVISFAKKHVLSCPLCTLKGYFCEICNSSQILYPFNTESTKRCEKCKTVFHLHCFNERYDKTRCPKCLRIEKREQQSLLADNYQLN